MANRALTNTIRKTLKTQVKGVEGRIYKRTEIMEAGPGYLKTLYRIDPDMDCNPMGNLHGGMIATLVDSYTSLSLIFGEQMISGVSLDLSISYQG